MLWMYFIDQDISRRNSILLERLLNYIWKVKCRTIFTDIKYRFLKNIPKQHKGYKKNKNEKVTNQKLENFGNLGNHENIVASFVISMFSISP